LRGVLCCAVSAQVSASNTKKKEKKNKPFDFFPLAFALFYSAASKQKKKCFPIWVGEFGYC
jgi:hypothetical protein